MNKTLIGAVGGGLILWIWQFISWGMINIHGSEMLYTDKQDQILTCIESSGLEEGSYFIPRVTDDATSEEQQAFMEERTGKPWATVTYHKELSYSFGMNLIRALVVDILAVFLLCYLLVGRDDLSFQKAIIASIMVGLIGYFTIPYLNTIWFETSSIAYLIDTIIQWTVVGAFLGWWLNRGGSQ